MSNKDGLYQVTYKGLCAGFVVENGMIRMSLTAPILKKKIDFWKTIAVRISK